MEVKLGKGREEDANRNGMERQIEREPTTRHNLYASYGT